MLSRITTYLRRRKMKVLKPFGRDLPAIPRLSLCDLNPEVADAWIDTFRDVDAVEILQGSVLKLDADALVSPANSFGDMSGGVDRAIDDFYEGRAQRAAIAAIRERFLGELPVGAALVVPVDSRRFPFLVVAPTMRVPGSVAGTLNAYLAMRGVLVAVTKHNADHPGNIRSLAVPGLCTGVGGMSPGVAARQMRPRMTASWAKGGRRSSIRPWRRSRWAPPATGAGRGRTAPDPHLIFMKVHPRR